MTSHVTQMRLESQSLMEQNRIETLESYTSTMSHEFRTTIGTCLMFLDGLISAKNLTPDAVRVLTLVIN